MEIRTAKWSGADAAQDFARRIEEMLFDNLMVRMSRYSIKAQKKRRAEVQKSKERFIRAKDAWIRGAEEVFNRKIDRMAKENTRWEEEG